MNQAVAVTGAEGYLFQPVPGGPGAHGPFDQQAHRRDLVLWTSEHPTALAGAGLLAGKAAR